MHRNFILMSQDPSTTRPPSFSWPSSPHERKTLDGAIYGHFIFLPFSNFKKLFPPLHLFSFILQVRLPSHRGKSISLILLPCMQYRNIHRHSKQNSKTFRLYRKMDFQTDFLYSRKVLLFFLIADWHVWDNLPQHLTVDTEGKEPPSTNQSALKSFYAHFRLSCLQHAHSAAVLNTCIISLHFFSFFVIFFFAICVI